RYVARCRRAHELVETDRTELLPDTGHVLAEDMGRRAQRVGIRSEFRDSMVGEDGCFRARPRRVVRLWPDDVGFHGPAAFAYAQARKAGHYLRGWLDGSNGDDDWKYWINVIE